MVARSLNLGKCRKLLSPSKPRMKPRIYTTRYLCSVDFCTSEVLKINGHTRQQHAFTSKKAEQYMKKAVTLLDFSPEDSGQGNSKEKLKSIDTDLSTDEDLCFVHLHSHWRPYRRYEMKYKQQKKNQMKAKKKVIIKNGFYMKYHIKVPIFTKIKTVVM